MAYNGSGTFSRLYDWTDERDAGNNIDSTKMDAEDDGFATGLSNAITKDGQTTITADLPMSGFKHTGVGTASARTHYPRLDQVQDGKLAWADAGGTADALTASYSPAVTALVDGQLCYVRAGAANATTTPTFSPNGITARNIVKEGGTALVAGDIVGDGHELILRYDLSNTRWELLNPGRVALASVDGLDDAFADVASATTTDIGAATSRNVRITGTTTITGLGTVAAGTTRRIRFAGALTFTHNGTSLILPGGANITTAANDTAVAVSLGSGNWLVTAYQRAASEPLAYATQAQQETGTSTVVAVSSGRQHFHPSAAKAWANLNGVGTVALRDSYNVSSVDDDGTGQYGFNLTNAFGAADFAFAGGGQKDTFIPLVGVQGHDATAQTAASFESSTGRGSTEIDLDIVSVALFGDLA